MPYLSPYGSRQTPFPNAQSNNKHSSCLNISCGKLKIFGEGIIQVQPDMAVVSLGVTTEGKELKDTQEENTKTTSMIINTLKNLGIPSTDIQTQSYQIFPQYDYIEGKQIFRNYRVEHILRVKIGDMNQIGEIIDSAVESGANSINNISFTIADPKKYYQQALLKALEDASSKARTIGIDINVKISQVPICIIEKSSQDISSSDITLLKAETFTPIQPGEINIIARIETIFTYA